jgi:hypothetical protein
VSFIPSNDAVLPIVINKWMHKNGQALILHMKYQSESVMQRIEAWLEMICCTPVSAEQE